MYKPLTADNVVAFVLADLAIIILACRIVGTLFEKIKQPRIVGEIIAGILIGPTVIGGHLDIAAVPGPHPVPALAGTGLTHQLYPLQAFSFLNAFGQVALIFYMFLVGLELDKSLLKGKFVQMGVVGVAVTAVPVALGFVCAAALTGATWRPHSISSTTFALFLGAGLSVTAFPVMARILQERMLLATDMGAVGVGSAAIVTVLMFLVISAASASAKHAGVPNSVGIRLALLAGLVAVLALLARPLLALVTRGYREGAEVPGNLLALLLVGALLTGLATDRIFAAPLVGGFLFGVAVPGRPGLARATIARMQDAVILLLLPVFLAVSGLNTNLRLLRGNLILGMLLFLVLMVVAKWLAGYLAGRATGLGNRDANVIGVLLNCRGLLILVVGLIGLQLKVITPQTQLVFVIGAIVTTMMTGPLMDLFMPPAAIRRETASLTVDQLTEGNRRISSASLHALR